MSGAQPARRAIVRWAWRLFRREWRQQLLILLLLTVAVAAAIAFATAAYNIAPVQGRTEFGSGNQYFIFEDPEPEDLAQKLDAGRDYFGTIDAIGHREVVVPGLVKTVDYRAQDPHGAYGGPLLDLRSGRYPDDPAEVAVTDWVASRLDAGVGSVLALDGTPRTVVGIVENPSDLGDEFALMTPDAMADSSFVVMLLDTTDARADGFRPPGEDHRIRGSKADLPEDVLAAILVLVVSTVALFLVALVSAASFTVIAQRRLPQLGVLSAVGGTEKQVRLTMIAGGAATGAVAAVGGAVLGLALWIAIAPRAEDALRYRIDELNIPWWLVVTGMLLAVLTSVGASWWPARTMARVPPVAALSGRRPEPSPVHRSAAVAVLLLGLGVTGLVIGGTSAESGEANLRALVGIGLGTLSVVAGILMLSPLAISLLGRIARRVPIAARLALRDLSRYQARSGAALAAITLVTAIPVVLIASAAAADNTAGPANLASSQIVVRLSDKRGPFVPDTAEADAMRAGIDEIAVALGDDVTVARLDVAMSADTPPREGPFGIPAISLAAQIADDGWRDVSVVYVASPEILAMHGLVEADLDPEVDIYTSERGTLVLLGETQMLGVERPTPPPAGNVGRLRQTYASLPSTFATASSMERHGWVAAQSGQWLLDTGQPLSNDQLDAARVAAASSGLTIETRDTNGGLTALRSGSVASGMLVTLCLLAMTVGLMRSEVAGELRTLTAAGATRSTRRRLTAVTAGSLALFGAVLGIAGAYLALAAGQLGHLTPLPLTELAAIGLGTPLLAAAGGWLFGGREPTGLARRPMD